MAGWKKFNSNDSIAPGGAIVYIKNNLYVVFMADTTIILNWLEGNIDKDPMFVEPSDGYYQLKLSSPCIDSGDPDASSHIYPATDLAGGYRIVNFRIDMGCYENQHTVNNNTYMLSSHLLYLLWDFFC